MPVMTPFHPFEVGQVDEFHDLSAMQVHFDDCVADLDVLDDFLVGFPTEIALFETDVVVRPVAIHLLMSNPVM